MSGSCSVTKDQAGRLAGRAVARMVAKRGSPFLPEPTLFSMQILHNQ
jgi:hypothetical protein